MYVFKHILLLPLYGLGRSHRGLYYPAQPPLFLGNIRFITRINIIPKTWAIPTFGSTVARCFSTIPFIHADFSTNQTSRRCLLSTPLGNLLLTISDNYKPRYPGDKRFLKRLARKHYGYE